jgi:hypothetical protein
MQFHEAADKASWAAYMSASKCAREVYSTYEDHPNVQMVEKFILAKDIGEGIANVASGQIGDAVGDRLPFWDLYQGAVQWGAAGCMNASVVIDLSIGLVETSAKYATAHFCMECAKPCAEYERLCYAAAKHKYDSTMALNSCLTAVGTKSGRYIDPFKYSRCMGNTPTEEAWRASVAQVDLRVANTKCSKAQESCRKNVRKNCHAWPWQ